MTQLPHHHAIGTILLTPNMMHTWAVDVQPVLHQTSFVPQVENRANQVSNEECCFILLAHENIHIWEAFTGCTHQRFAAVITKSNMYHCYIQVYLQLYTTLRV